MSPIDDLLKNSIWACEDICAADLFNTAFIGADMALELTNHRSPTRDVIRVSVGSDPQWIDIVKAADKAIGDPLACPDHTFIEGFECVGNIIVLTTGS